MSHEAGLLEFFAINKMSALLSILASKVFTAPKKITERQHQCCDNSAMVLFSLKTKELLKNGLQDSIVFNENSITSIIIVHGSLK